ncbi:regulatory LuxR family protein [Tamaricihabitans halophyticus]|uniref:Regulatory LuxR family protein n=1 Tax=Tamaricihabitans halophyticus TaxID=1262583 RepID=A0A4R2QJZ4_9PSEU|nr:regulatory LuxR family protein [Tamaricihabitans halophyticus]
MPESTIASPDLVPLDRLTPREHEVLVLLASGRSNASIAATLVLSPSAVAKHINSIFGKLDIPPTEVDNRRVLAALKYLHATAQGSVHPDH